MSVQYLQLSKALSLLRMPLTSYIITKNLTFELMLVYG